MHVSGALTLLGGTLDVSFLDFAAGAGDSFDILDFASLSGTFSALHLPALGGGLYWDSSNLYATGALSVQAVPRPATVRCCSAGCCCWRLRGCDSAAGKEAFGRPSS